MSSIAEGLTVGGESAEKAEGTISTTEDFMASLAADLGGEIPGAEGVEPPATVGVPESSGEASTAEGDNSGADDSDLTPEQKELKELHALLGRQSAELGELRQLVEKPKDEPVEQWQAPPPITSDVIEELENAVEENGGQQMAVWALTNRPDLYDNVLALWQNVSDADKIAAQRFDRRYEAALAEQNAEAEAAEAAKFQEGLATQLDADVAALAPEYGLTPGTADTDALLAEVIKEVRPSVQKLVVSKDAGEREDGLRTVLELAKARATTPSSVQTPEEKAALAAALERSKQGAGLGTGSQRPAAPVNEGGGEQTADFADAFSKALLETPSTSVASGLTYGGK